jgi:hypothetical protein
MYNATMIADATLSWTATWSPTPPWFSASTMTISVMPPLIWRRDPTKIKTISFTGCRFDLAQIADAAEAAGAFAGRPLHTARHRCRSIRGARAAMTVPSRMDLTHRRRQLAKLSTKVQT